MGSPTPTCLPPHFFRLLSSLSPATATSCDHLHLHQPALAASPAPPYFLQQWATKSSLTPERRTSSAPTSSCHCRRRCCQRHHLPRRLELVAARMPPPQSAATLNLSPPHLSFFLFFFFLRTLPHLSLAGFRIKLGTQARQIQVATSS